ncbi:hypothetical protein [Thermococcus sp.]|uniref:hypothetical protein n=1 Tax=Thermococcus sp. TaxID=35749 RepID=UPI0025EF8231|nr:hypothetical protein [Thermococcus sp.]
MIGMFIFGRKKEEDLMERYRRLARKYGLTVEQVKKIGWLIASMTKNLPELAANADPEQDVRRMYKILDIEHLPSKEGKKYIYIYIKSIEAHAHHKRGVRAKHKDAIKIHIVHPFLALTLSHLAKSTSKHVGHAVGDALDGLVVEGHEFEKLRSNPEMLAELIIQFAKDRGIPAKEEDKDKLVIAFQKAAKIADKLVADASEERLDALYQALAEETEDPLYILKRNGVDIEPELEEFREFLAEISGKKPEEIQATKFKQVQKQVEEELRAKGVPEEQVKVVAPRLATAVWLENQIRALKESTPARIYGGVPAAELRNLREKVLAKKHVAEKAAELVEKNWMKGTIVPLEERHIDPKMVPLVREHAAGMLEDIKALAERVKRGEIDYLDARTILVVERDLLDRTQEAIERTLGNPEYLIENKRAWGVEDKYLIKKEVLEKMHEELKPHLETARVKTLER